MGICLDIQHIQALWASPAIVVQEKHEYGLVSNYCVVNKRTEKVPGKMLDLEAEMGRLREASGQMMLDLLQYYW